MQLTGIPGPCRMVLHIAQFAQGSSKEITWALVYARGRVCTRLPPGN